MLPISNLSNFHSLKPLQLIHSPTLDTLRRVSCRSSRPCGRPLRPPTPPHGSCVPRVRNSANGGNYPTQVSAPPAGHKGSAVGARRRGRGVIIDPERPAGPAGTANRAHTHEKTAKRGAHTTDRGSSTELDTADDLWHNQQSRHRLRGLSDARPDNGS